MIKDSQARISRIERWGDYSLFSLESPRIASRAKPGQCIMVRIGPNPYPLLRRPFSIHAADKTHLEIFFQVTGIGTSLLSQKEKEDPLDILGPLGKGFTTGKELEEKEVVAIGGGRGIAPLYFLARILRSEGASVKIFYGGKALEDLPLREKFEREGFTLYCSTDDGSYGYHGLVSDYFAQELEKLTPVRLYSCGPEAMMEKIAMLARGKNIPGEFSLESIMGCGIGACWSCVKRIKTEEGAQWTRVCLEGPVFNREDILWQGEEL